MSSTPDPGPQPSLGPRPASEPWFKDWNGYWWGDVVKDLVKYGVQVTIAVDVAMLVGVIQPTDARALAVFYLLQAAFTLVAAGMAAFFFMAAHGSERMPSSALACMFAVVVLYVLTSVKMINHVPLGNYGVQILGLLGPPFAMSLTWAYLARRKRNLERRPGAGI